MRFCLCLVVIIVPLVGPEERINSFLGNLKSTIFMAHLSNLPLTLPNNTLESLYPVNSVFLSKISSVTCVLLRNYVSGFTMITKPWVTGLWIFRTILTLAFRHHLYCNSLYFFYIFCHIFYDLHLKQLYLIYCIHAISTFKFICTTITRISWMYFTPHLSPDATCYVIEPPAFMVYVSEYKNQAKFQYAHTYMYIIYIIITICIYVLLKGMQIHSCDLNLRLSVLYRNAVPILFYSFSL